MELFVERARAVVAGFSLDDLDDVVAGWRSAGAWTGSRWRSSWPTARMVSMTAQDVQGSPRRPVPAPGRGRRGIERHQTLRQAVGWSYDLLGDERTDGVEPRCGVLGRVRPAASGGGACDSLDEYALLDVVDSLVRKSLVTVEHAGGHARYGLLETIRQFAEEQLAATGAIGEVRDSSRPVLRRAGRGPLGRCGTGPRQREALDWVDP